MSYFDVDKAMAWYIKFLMKQDQLEAVLSRINAPTNGTKRELAEVLITRLKNMGQHLRLGAVSEHEIRPHFDYIRNMMCVPGRV